MMESTPKKQLKSLELWLAECNETVPVLALGIRDTAKAIGLCERSTWQLVKDGKLPHLRVGSRVIIPIDLLKQFLIQQASN